MQLINAFQFITVWLAAQAAALPAGSPAQKDTAAVAKLFQDTADALAQKGSETAETARALIPHAQQVANAAPGLSAELSKLHPRDVAPEPKKLPKYAGEPHPKKLPKEPFPLEPAHVKDAPKSFFEAKGKPKAPRAELPPKELDGQRRPKKGPKGPVELAEGLQGHPRGFQPKGKAKEPRAEKLPFGEPEDKEGRVPKEGNGARIQKEDKALAPEPKHTPGEPKKLPKDSRPLNAPKNAKPEAKNPKFAGKGIHARAKLPFGEPENKGDRVPRENDGRAPESLKHVPGKPKKLPNDSRPLKAPKDAKPQARNLKFEGKGIHARAELPLKENEGDRVSKVGDGARIQKEDKGRIPKEDNGPRKPKLAPTPVAGNLPKGALPTPEHELPKDAQPEGAKFEDKKLHTREELRFKKNKSQGFKEDKSQGFKENQGGKPKGALLTLKPKLPKDHLPKAPKDSKPVPNSPKGAEFEAKAKPAHGPRSVEALDKQTADNLKSIIDHLDQLKPTLSSNVIRDGKTSPPRFASKG